jgi:hypothetical protein
METRRSPRPPNQGVNLEVLGPQATKELRSLGGVLGRIFSVRLDDSTIEASTTLKNGKEFCVGLLENPVTHPWGKEVSKLHPKDQASVAGSLFLARKVLPCPPDDSQWKRHAELMSKPGVVLTREYRLHLEKVLSKLFPRGWDARHYAKRVFSHTPTSSSCLEYSRKKGGVQRFLAEAGPSWFQDACLAGGDPSPHVVRYSIVRTGGKDRGVTVASGRHQLLAPLHRAIYDHISEQPWLLRGGARGKKFKSFQTKEGEVFVSGDYESATDNLSTEVTEFILSFILGRSCSVPEGIKAQAMLSLRAQIQYPGGRVVKQARGQLMGNFLSFPLLCLQNYLAFTYFVPREGVPVRINGDDIVFRCTPAEFDVWAEGVSTTGLTLSRGKTMVDRRTFSLNSSFFFAGGARVHEVPVIRLKPVEDTIPSPGDMAQFTRGWKGLAHSLVGGLWLRRHAAMIKATGRSVLGLGIRATNAQIHHSGLSAREAWYRGPSRSAVVDPESPVPRLKRFAGSGPADEWAQIPNVGEFPGQRLKSWATEYREICFAYAWSKDRKFVDAKEAWWEDVKATGRENQWANYRRALTCSTRPIPFSGVTAAHRKMAGLCNQLSLRSPVFVVRKKTMWIPRDSIPRYRFPGIGSSLALSAVRPPPEEEVTVAPELVRYVGIPSPYLHLSNGVSLELFKVPEPVISTKVMMISRQRHAPARPRAGRVRRDFVRFVPAGGGDDG